MGKYGTKVRKQDLPVALKAPSFTLTLKEALSEADGGRGQVAEVWRDGRPMDEAL